jgi:dihydrofolate synthase/folylpolyglutamate synthase
VTAASDTSVVLTAPSSSEPLSEWLAWLETIHPLSIDMGLERVGQVADRLGMRPVSSPLVLVGGTNGKGSTVSMLAAIYVAAGYRVGSYTSPHIHDFRERIQVDGEMAKASEIVDALAFVEGGREPQTLTYFEYTTLAAMRVFQQRQCDVYVLEVGLGGRLDATNLWDADCSVVTSIALDHEDYLGSDLSVIATEKAAIGRQNKVLVVGDPDPPKSLHRFAEGQGIIVDHVGALSETELPRTGLAGIHQRRNAACAVAVVNTLAKRLPVNKSTLRQALLGVVIPARFEELVIQGVPVLLDVAHNPAGASALAVAWSERYPSQQAHVIFACLADKDLDGIVTALAPITAHWHTVPLEGPRTLSSDELAKQIQGVVHVPVTPYLSASDAFAAAFQHARENTQAILVAGSFYTIADVRGVLEAAVSP